MAEAGPFGIGQAMSRRLRLRRMVADCRDVACTIDDLIQRSDLPGAFVREAVRLWVRAEWVELDRGGLRTTPTGAELFATAYGRAGVYVDRDGLRSLWDPAGDVVAVGDPSNLYRRWTDDVPGVHPMHGPYDCREVRREYLPSTVNGQSVQATSNRESAF